MSETPKQPADAPDETEDNSKSPGEEDTETVAGFPKDPPDSKDDEPNQNQ